MVCVPAGQTKSCREKERSGSSQRRATYHLSAFCASSRRGKTWEFRNERSCTRSARNAAARGSACPVGREPKPRSFSVSGANVVVIMVFLPGRLWLSFVSVRARFSGELGLPLLSLDPAILSSGGRGIRPLDLLSACTP